MKTPSFLNSCSKEHPEAAASDSPLIIQLTLSNRIYQGNLQVNYEYN